VFIKTDNLSKKEMVPGIIALILIAISNIITFSSTRKDLIALTREDGLVESIAVACYVGSVVTLIILTAKAIAANRSNYPGFQNYLVYLVLAFAVLIFAGEEISWGQRFFNFKIPDFWKQANRQGEANLHNLNFWEALDTSGNRKQGITRLFSSVAFYSYFWFFVFLVVPLLNKYWSRAAVFFKNKGIPVFNFIYGILFLLNFFTLEFIERTGIELRPVGEVKETNFAVLYLAACISILLKFEYVTHPSLNHDHGRLRIR